MIHIDAHDHIPYSSPSPFFMTMISARRLELCLVLLTLTPKVACFLVGTTTGIQSIRRVIRPSPATHHAQRQSAVHMVAPAESSTTAIAWPDVMPTPSLNQPVRSRIVAVAPGSVDSPFNHRGKRVPWFEVRGFKLVLQCNLLSVVPCIRRRSLACAQPTAAVCAA